MSRIARVALLAAALVPGAAFPAMPAGGIMADIDASRCTPQSASASATTAEAEEDRMATGGDPAHVSLPFSRPVAALRDDAPPVNVALTLTPQTVDRTESYLVTVEALPPDTEPVMLGQVSFFPPPREGESREFILTLPPAAARSATEAGRLDLRVTLTPLAPDATLRNSAVRVTGVTAP